MNEVRYSLLVCPLEKLVSALTETEPVYNRYAGSLGQAREKREGEFIPERSAMSESVNCFRPPSHFKVTNHTTTDSLDYLLIRWF